ncbi:MAG: threonine--tRNA ligase [Candidatus Moeniiplasma glomeromycotorum]|nr:threonine--tRNA ligase [Candidatus Moeniiplasma glomeromycotorum]MCE8162553.1 threonine--tRNA ligase [Candidatus Moeniiplasma glomeromycotorum]MCE8166520.1 threonine--tRNA ligase [Candidatus Moeniiplasma glomeromycotorum]MCE8167008.1 threonine--tRNA ligase [Candidatus Moeniiplasma glomeromycotorum]
MNASQRPKSPANEINAALDHRTIAKELELYLVKEQAGQGLPLLLPNWVIIRNKIVEFLQKKQQKFRFQEVITPILGSAELYQTSGHLTHYQEYMFPALSRNNETLYLRPMTCPHHCLVFQQKTRSYRDLPLRLCENSILHRYEASGGLKGLERARWFELADHHIFTTLEQLKEEFKKNYRYIDDILTSFNFSISRRICALHDPHNSEKYHPDQKIWDFSEELLTSSLNELGLKGKYTSLTGEAAFYGPKLDIEVQTADGKNITIATIQLDFVLPQKFGLNYVDKEGKEQIPVIIHQSPFGSYQRFIALLLEQTGGKLPFWLAPCQVTILPFNEEAEIKNYCEKLAGELEKNGLRVKIFSKDKLRDRIRQMYQKKIPYYLVIGKKELEKKSLELKNTHQADQSEVLTEKELISKLNRLNINVA